MTTTSYQSSATMHPNTAPATYQTTDHSHSVNYHSTPTVAATPESRFNKAYLISIPGVLKLVSIVLCFVALICLEVTSQCYGTHAFLATVSCLVILIQGAIIVIQVCRLNITFLGVDFEFFDLFATAHDALYLLIAACVTINYCRVPGQISAGVMGILAFSALLGNVVTMVVARRVQGNTDKNTNGSR